MQILKLGGSVVTKKHGYMEAEEENIERLAKVIGAYWSRKKDLILVHGAGSFGHPSVIMHGINKGVKTPKDKMGYSETHCACSYLSVIIVNHLIAHNVPAISIPPAVIIEQKNKRIVKFNEKIVFEYLKKGYLPVLYGDIVPDTKLGGSVCSGDQIVTYLGKKAKRVIFGSDVDGVMINGELLEEVTKKNIKDIRKHLKNSKALDVTGGMAGKVEEIMKIRKPAILVNATKPKRVEEALYEKKTLGTEIKA